MKRTRKKIKVGADVMHVGWEALLFSGQLEQTCGRGATGPGTWMMKRIGPCTQQGRTFQAWKRQMLKPTVKVLGSKRKTLLEFGVWKERHQTMRWREGRKETDARGHVASGREWPGLLQQRLCFSHCSVSSDYTRSGTVHSERPEWILIMKVNIMAKCGGLGL